MRDLKDKLVLAIHENRIEDKELLYAQIIEQLKAEEKSEEQKQEIEEDYVWINERV